MKYEENNFWLYVLRLSLQHQFVSAVNEHEGQECVWKVCIFQTGAHFTSLILVSDSWLETVYCCLFRDVSRLVFLCRICVYS
jgi:hypothetical protein